MPRTKKQIGMDTIDRQIEEAQEAVIKAKKKYNEATAQLKALLDKKKELQTAALVDAVMKSKHSYEEILRYIQLLSVGRRCIIYKERPPVIGGRESF